MFLTMLLDDLVDLFEEKSKEEIVETLNKDYTREQIEEAYEEIKSLKEEGLLLQKIRIKIIQAL